MSPPTLWQHARQIIGRALRESGQALDRLGVKTASLAVTKHDFYDDPVVYEDHLSRHRHLFPLLTSGRPILHPQVAFLAPCSTLIGTVVVGPNSSIWYGAVVRGDSCEHATAFHASYDSLDDDVAASTVSASSSSSSSSSVPQPSAAEGKTHSDTSVSSSSSSSSSTGSTVSRPTLDDSPPPLSTTLRLPQPWPLSPHRVKDQTTHHGGGIFIGRDTNLQDGCIVTARTAHTVIGNGVTIGHLAQLHSCTVHDYALIGMGSVLLPGVVVESEAMVAAGAVVLENTRIPAGELWVGAPARKLRDLTLAQRDKLHYQSSEYVTVALTHRNVMKLGGNVDPTTGIAVLIQADERIDDDWTLALNDDHHPSESIASGLSTSQQLPNETTGNETNVTGKDEHLRDR